MKPRNHNEQQPPRWSIRFLKWFCPAELLEGILGDMFEDYHNKLDVKGRSAANRQFIWTMMRFFRPGIIFRNQVKIHFNMSLLRNHLLVAIRHMRKYRFYNLLNIAGLSLAVSFVILTFLFVRSELAYDQFHSRKDQIWRIYHKIMDNDSGLPKAQSAVTTAPLSRDLATVLPEIESFTRHGSSTVTIRQGDKAFDETATFVDPAFLTMFDFQLEGNRRTALSAPNSVIISGETSKKYFGTDNPVGQTLLFDMNGSAGQYLVTGVIEARKERSSIQFDFLLPFDQYRLLIAQESLDSYNVGIVENYVYCPTAGSAEELEQRMTAALQQFVSQEGDGIELGLQSMSTLHFEDRIIGNATYISPRKLYTMGGLALLVLVIACLNFINLTTGFSLHRLKELGLRKTLGALKSQMRYQLVAEMALHSFICVLLGLGLAALFLPEFSQLIGVQIPLSIDFTGLFFLIVLALSIGLLAGLIQGFILLRTELIEAVRGNARLTSGDSWFQRGIIALQFALAALLLAGALIIRSQMRYIQTKDLGFEEERLIEMDLGNTSDLEQAHQLVERFRTELLKDRRIISVSASMNSAREPWTSLVFEQSNGPPLNISFNQVDAEYLKTMDIHLAAGVQFDPASEQRDAILVNQALLRRFGWETHEGKQIPGKSFSQAHRIIGVVKDFHYSSLQQEIKPLILTVYPESVLSGVTGLSTYVWPPNLYRLMVRLGPGDLPPLLKHLEEVWANIRPEKEFAFHFVDEVLQNQYAEQRRWSQIIDLGSIFAIVVAWLGLLGLVRLSIQRRLKEVGIRRILGASVSRVVVLLSGRFIALVIAGNLVALPVAWYFSRKWLNSFSYRIELGPGLFIGTFALILIVTAVSLGWQTATAAHRNPARVLKSE